MGESNGGEGVSSPPKKKGTITDVTDEYLRNAKPGVGNIENQFKTNANSSRKELNAEKDHKDEIETADWIKKKFGGDIVIINENLKDRNDVVKYSANYNRDGKLWDLKTPEGKNGIDRGLRHGSEQIERNTGGVIIDISNSILGKSNTMEEIMFRIPKRGRTDFDVIIKDKDELVKILRYKK